MTDLTTILWACFALLIVLQFIAAAIIYIVQLPKLRKRWFVSYIIFLVLGIVIVVILVLI